MTRASSALPRAIMVVIEGLDKYSNDTIWYVMRVPSVCNGSLVIGRPVVESKLIELKLVLQIFDSTSDSDVPPDEINN